jgi:hypothetical protein
MKDFDNEQKVEECTKRKRLTKEIYINCVYCGCKISRTHMRRHRPCPKKVLDDEKFKKIKNKCCTLAL